MSSLSRTGAAGSGVTLLELKMRAQSQRDQQARLAALHHAALVLVAHHLHARHLPATLAALHREAGGGGGGGGGGGWGREVVADNVDLVRVLSDWCEAEEQKYGRRVRLTRRRGEDEEAGSGGAVGGGGGDEVVKEREKGKRKARMSYLPPLNSDVGTPSALPALYRDGAAADGRREDRDGAEEKTQLSRERRSGMKSAPASSAASTAASPTAATDKPKKRVSTVDTAGTAVDFSVAGSSALSVRGAVGAAEVVVADATDGLSSSALPAMLRPTRTPPTFDGAYADYAAVIQRDILSVAPATSFSSVVGLHAAKQLLSEAVLLPCRYPQFFTGLLTPWKGVLLYGPPGTGKTMLARALASECGTTFFNISSASVTSKYRGDSEKLVRVLFELARHHAPSTIFIDEVDALMSSRDSGGGAGGGGLAGDSDASRRMKSELLIQLDGLAHSTAQVFVLCASNLPWELDQALLRRLEKRILVGLPGQRQRCELLRQQLADRAADGGVRYEAVAERTRGWSCADLVSLCKESAMRPVRRLMRQLMSKENEGVAVDAEIVLEAVVQADVEAALACTKPSVGLRDLGRYDEWHREYGATVEVEGVLSEDADDLTADGEVRVR